MSLNNLKFTIEKADFQELEVLSNVVVSIIEDQNSEQRISALLKQNTFSHAGKALFFSILKYFRLSNEAALIKRVEASRNLLRIKEEINYKISHMAEFVDADKSSITTPDVQDEDQSIIAVYQSFLGRTPGQEEINIWNNNFVNGLEFREFFSQILSSEEAKLRTQLLSNVTDNEFVQALYEILFNRGAVAQEINHWQTLLKTGQLTRLDIIKQCFEAAFEENAITEKETAHDSDRVQIMGSTDTVSKKDWQKKSQEILRQKKTESHRQVDQIPRFYINRSPGVLVSAIASLYKGEKYIEQFLENITSQSIFNDYCELLIIDAASPENEAETIERYCKKFNNVIYKRINYRIGIYDAWNVGVDLARGEFLTNTNLDDLRRADSLELQASVLDSLPFVDVVYQDFYYTFDHDLSFEQISEFGFKSNLSVLTPYNLLAYNSPHNGPMWRKSLHDELGYFDTEYKSAGDYEFWMRCLNAGKNFYKINEPHVAYFQNPEGISTRSDTRGVIEARNILKKYARKLISSNTICEYNEFIQKINMPYKNGARPEEQNRYNDVQMALRKCAADSKRQIFT
ncbi:MAG: DUF4214 domain-containing protein [Gammaproteobacteria bacterium]|nr:DUF4214 domain-containing protein [Gammaproteobacteria bacterium]